MRKHITKNMAKIFAVGGAAAGMGAAAIGLAYMAGWIFCTIPATSGYIAVTLFLLALLTSAVALGAVYFCGCWIVIKGKFSK